MTYAYASLAPLFPSGPLSYHKVTTSILVGRGRPGVPWPETPTDLPHAATCIETQHGGRGGFDLSLGGEAVPLQWVNEVDGASPPPIVFVRRCIDVDVRPDWLGKHTIAKACSRNQQEAFDSHVDCVKAGFPGKPSNHKVNHHSSTQAIPACSSVSIRPGMLSALASAPARRPNATGTARGRPRALSAAAIARCSGERHGGCRSSSIR